MTKIAAASADDVGLTTAPLAHDTPVDACADLVQERDSQSRQGGSPIIQSGLLAGAVDFATINPTRRWEATSRFYRPLGPSFQAGVGVTAEPFERRTEVAVRDFETGRVQLAGSICRAQVCRCLRPRASRHAVSTIELWTQRACPPHRGIWLDSTSSTESKRTHGTGARGREGT